MLRVGAYRVAFSDLKFYISSYLIPYGPQAAAFLLLPLSALYICNPSCTAAQTLIFYLSQARRRPYFTVPPALSTLKYCFLCCQFHLSTAATTNPQPLGPLNLPTMCTVQYTLYSCEHWVPEPQMPDGEVLRICKQAEEERLGFACPQTQREHKVVNRSQGPCRNCMWKNILR